MTRRNVQVLAAIVAGLVLLLFVLDTTDDIGHAPATGPLLADFEPLANDISRITIEGPGEHGPVELDRIDDAWVVASTHGYPADIGKLRQLVVALADAEIVEEKTADPDNYDRLGVGDESGTRVTLGGEGFSVELILGETAQGDFRYARRAGEAQSYLIDQNPEAPASSSDWLFADLLDVPADRVRRVTIAHADGETIVIEKSDPEQTTFSVRDIPEGRALSYASAGNGVGGALARLSLENVRPAGDGDADVTTVFETFDEQTVTATIREDDAAAWVSFVANPDFDGINERLAGWEYRLPDYKSDLLSRRWSDLLKPEDSGSPAEDPVDES